MLKGKFLSSILASLFLFFASETFIYAQPKNCLYLKIDNKVTSLSGIVTEINHPVAKIKSDDNKVYILRLGPWWYWKEKKWQLKEGDKVNVTGYIQGDLLFPIIIKTNGQEMKFRDKNGIPCWKKMHRRFKPYR